jgi:4-amino-4-deoxy-L-arabinose transferase-like glycosyltransferase
MTTLTFLITVTVLFYLVSIAFFLRGNYTWSLFFLLGGSFLLRTAMAVSDPFIHDWDERFHALVAKNMMSDPFKPVLFKDPAIPYDYKAWCCNHIWVHKQPLFLWQIAASMKLFGVNEFALRLPSVLMGTAMVFFTQRIARRLSKDQVVAYIAAFLFSLSWYQLELTTGVISLDHNDVAFSFYILASIWAYSGYLRTGSWKWIILTGLFAGGAILCKWLVGLLVFAGWGISILLDPAQRNRFKPYLHLGISALIAIVVMLPWQLYILDRFPVESAWEYDYNNRHLYEALEGHEHPWYFFFSLMPLHFGKYFLPFLLAGLVLTVRTFRSNGLAIALISCFLITYLFFSIAATRLQSFTFIAAPVAFIFISIGLVWLWNQLKTIQFLSYLALSLVLCLGIYTLKPWNLLGERKTGNIERTNEVYNASVYRSLPDSIEGKKTIVINNRELRNIELMFYKNVTAYSGLLDAPLLDSLHTAGYRIFSFPAYGNEQLPSYITDRHYIRILNKQLK